MRSESEQKFRDGYIQRESKREMLAKIDNALGRIDEAFLDAYTPIDAMRSILVATFNAYAAAHEVEAYQMMERLASEYAAKRRDKQLEEGVNNAFSKEMREYYYRPNK